ncbi:hypothetical protein LCGC14_1482690 [marine sediment metagenome]|uniref:Uncharacterized protein n=1 Tax=marine sediment metagenome TaxID=412755 RepID=A0A0F9JV23_9ZZZZ
MKDVKSIDNKQLNEMVKMVNGIVDEEDNPRIGEKIPFIGKTKEFKIEAFSTAYDKLYALLDGGAEFEFPQEIQDFYADLYADEIAESGGTEGPPATGPVEPEKKKKPAAKATAKATPKKTTPKKAAAPKEKKPRAVSAVKLFISDRIGEAKWTKKQIVDKAVAKFPDKSISTAQTYISDGFNEKYCPFDKPVVKNDEGILSFKG